MITSLTSWLEVGRPALSSLSLGTVLSEPLSLALNHQTMGPDQPTVIVWRGVPQPLRNRDTSEPLRTTIPREEGELRDTETTGGRLRFINSSGTARIRDPRAKRLVRSHVMTGTRRKKRKADQQQAAVSEDSSQLDNLQNAAVKNRKTYTPIMRPILTFESGVQQYLRASSPITLEGGLYKVVFKHMDTVSNAIYPMESYFRYNPLRLKWLDNMTNNMLFHAALYMASTYLGLMEGNTQSDQAMAQMSQAIFLINEKLQGPTPDVSDNTISAVSCLAMGEVSDFLGQQQAFY